mgnify:CR=1 FL=1
MEILTLSRMGNLNIWEQLMKNMYIKFEMDMTDFDDDVQKPRELDFEDVAQILQKLNIKDKNLNYRRKNMLSREHRLYKAFKQMRDKEKEYQRKRDEMGWRGLDGPFTKEEIELHKEFFEFMKKVLKEEKDLDFKLSDLWEMYKEDNQ